jgi:menaquinone-dependent protoporphyrinogen oxidase
MSRVLILYGTTDGHTKKIAAALGETFRAERCDVTVVDARDVTPDVRPERFDGVVIAASVHASGYQRAVQRWVRAYAVQLNHMPTAFLSVCLGIVERRPEVQQEVFAIMRRFERQTGWRPTIDKPVAGALLYRRYGLLKRWVMRRIVAKGGGDTDTSRDYEYTDWENLRAFARDFARRQLGAAQEVAVTAAPTLSESRT